MDRSSPRKLRTSVTLVRALRSYVESHLSDLFDIDKFDPAILEGDSPYGKDDFVEATLSINGHSLTLPLSLRLCRSE